MASRTAPRTEQIHMSLGPGAESSTESASPVAAVGSPFDKALKPEASGTRRSDAHPFMDYESDSEAQGEARGEKDDGDAATVARLLEEHRRRSGAPDAATMLRRGPAQAVMPMPGVVDTAWPQATGGRHASLRIRLEGSELGISAEQLEQALARILQLNPQSVKLKQ